MKPIQPVNTVRRKVVVMRLPNLAAQATEVEAPEEETVAAATPANKPDPAGKVAPRLFQSVVAGGAIVALIAAYLYLNSDSSTTPIEQTVDSSVHIHEESLAHADSPQLEPPQPLMAPDAEPELAEPELALNASQSATTIEPTPASSDVETSDFAPMPERDSLVSTTLNGPRASAPTSFAATENAPSATDYPTTNPQRWRYPEFEIRSPLQTPADAPRFADRLGGSTPAANERDATTWERR